MTLALLLALTASFESYLATNHPPADGFVAPRPGVVRAAGHGRVVTARGDTIAIEHVYYENHRRRAVRSEYRPLSKLRVKEGDLVARGQKIGTSGDELQFLPGEAFVATRRKLFVPQDEPALVLIDQERRRLAIYARGKLQRQVEVGFGQRPGRKRRQGDLKTPKGMYFVVYKHRGEIPGRYGAYYGGHWIKINYPNPWDAAWGLEQKLIDRDTASAIQRDWSAKRLTAQKTPLGGGIGFHGWAGEWSWDDSGWLSWGCVVFHNEDMRTMFDQIPLGAMVVIL